MAEIPDLALCQNLINYLSIQANLTTKSRGELLTQHPHYWQR